MARAADMYFTDADYWISVDGNEGTVGMTSCGTENLGEIIYVDLPEVGELVQFDEPVGNVESVHSAVEIYSPATGTVIQRNDKLVENSELVSTSPWEDGWLFKIKLATKDELTRLLSAKQYYDEICMYITE